MGRVEWCLRESSYLCKSHLAIYRELGKHLVAYTWEVKIELLIVGTFNKTSSMASPVL